MALPQVPFDLLTKTSSVRQHFAAEASDLGWTPGQWPESIWAVSPNGHGMELPLTGIELDGTRVYQATGALGQRTTIRIFND